MKDIQYPVCTPEEFISYIGHFRPADVLYRVRERSNKLAELPRKMEFITLPPHIGPAGAQQKILVTPHFLGLIARYSLLHGHSLSPGTMTHDAFLRMLKKATELYDPADRPGAITIIFRVLQEQAPYQEQLWWAVPRALLMYLDANSKIQRPAFDIDEEFTKQFGLTVREFLTFGVAFFAQLNAEPVFYPLGGWHTRVPAFAPLFTEEKKRAFLRLTVADQARFQSVSVEMSTSGTGTERYDFNVLFRYPVIDLGDGRCIAPLLDLLIWRLYYAPFHELSLIYDTGGGSNPFRAFFGTVFNEYTGLLLRDALEGCSIIQEAGANPPGPVDWLVRIGDIALAIECRIGDFTLATKASGDELGIDKDLNRIAIDVIKKFPDKRRQLEADAERYGLEGVDRWHLLIVVKEDLLPIPLVRGRIKEILSEDREYHMLSISDLEQLLALHEPNGVTNVLDDKASDPFDMEKDFRTFLYEQKEQIFISPKPIVRSDIRSILRRPGSSARQLADSRYATYAVNTRNRPPPSMGAVGQNTGFGVVYISPRRARSRTALNNPVSIPPGAV